jgi:hypothetical protein
MRLAFDGNHQQASFPQTGLSRRATVSYHDTMQTSHVHERTNTSPSASRFSPAAFFLALLIAPLVGLIWGWVAETVEFYVAPFLLFPILVGVFTGLSIVGLTRFAQIGHRPMVLLAVVLAAALAACGQHYFHYLSTYGRVLPLLPFKAAGKNTMPGAGEADGREGVAQQKGAIPKEIQKELTPSFTKYMLAQAQRGRPLPGGYVAVGWAAWLTWAIEALLTLAAAVAVTLPGIRVPYCNRCRTWYRTIRNGKIDVHTAQLLAAICEVDEIHDFRSPRYRLSCCQGGCGPTRCELSWEEESSGAVDLVRVWLDGEQRKRVNEILDGLAEEVDSG